MAVTWRIKGLEFSACNCNWGCPCQFNERPSLGQCTGTFVMRIESGHCGDTPLAGVVWGMCAEWPGAIHEGNGRLLVFVDQRATPAQRKALVAIGHGEHSAEGTMFSIFRTVCPTRLEPAFPAIRFDFDPGQRTARVVVPGVMEVTGEPIRNPVTGEPHYSKLVLPTGFEFKEAEFASSDFRATGPIRMERKRGHAHFAQVQWGPSGYLDG